MSAIEARFEGKVERWNPRVDAVKEGREEK